MSDVTCQRCGSKCELFLCVRCTLEMRKTLEDMPWWLDRLAETAIGQERLSDSGGRRLHKAGLERYADPKPALDGQGGTEGQRRLEEDLEDRKFRARLLSQGRVNASASDLFDEVQNMLGTWIRDVCERSGIYWVSPGFIGPLRANEERETVRTAQSAALWLKARVSSLASAPCALETYLDVKKAAENIERAVNRPPEPKTCGPCPTVGVHTEKGFEMRADVRSRCGTQLLARPNTEQVRCGVCKQTHQVEALTTRLFMDMHYMSFTIRELLDVVLPRAETPIPRRTLYDWAAKGKLEASGYDERGTPKFLLADVRKLRTQYVRRTA